MSGAPIPLTPSQMKAQLIDGLLEGLQTDFKTGDVKSDVEFYYALDRIRFIAQEMWTFQSHTGYPRNAPNMRHGLVHASFRIGRESVKLFITQDIPKLRGFFQAVYNQQRQFFDPIPPPGNRRDVSTYDLEVELEVYKAIDGYFSQDPQFALSNKKAFLSYAVAQADNFLKFINEASKPGGSIRAQEAANVCYFCCADAISRVLFDEQSVFNDCYSRQLRCVCPAFETGDRAKILQEQSTNADGNSMLNFVNLPPGWECNLSLSPCKEHSVNEKAAFLLNQGRKAPLFCFKGSGKTNYWQKVFFQYYF